MENHDQIITVTRVITQLNNGIHNVGTMSKELGIGEKKLRAALKSAGFTYDNSSKSWHGDPNDNPMSNYYTKSNAGRPLKSDKVNNPNKTDSTNKPNKPHTPPNVPQSPTFDFTPEQYAALIELANERIQGHTANTAHTAIHEPHTHEPPTNTQAELHARIVELNPTKMTRKVFVIDSNVGEALDDFAASRKITKSELITLAILDIIEKYK